jgi:hypothetical protein
VSVAATRVGAVVRAGVGAVMLLRPQVVAGVIGAPAHGPHPVLRILGLRHVVQGMALVAAPSRANGNAAAAVDCTHVATCVAYAGIRRSSRGAVLREAALETGILAATWLSRPAADQNDERSRIQR